MDRKSQIEQHNRNVKDAFQAAEQGRTINLSALIGGAEQVHIDDWDGRESRETPYSDGWRVDSAE